jgi:hypothetical protein
MSNLQERLVIHLQKLAAGDISESTTHRLMALLRELLEERNERRKYPALAMFCDWSVHTKLDRSAGGGALLDMLDEIWANSTTVDQQIQILTNELSPQKLRVQMEQLLGSSFIHPGVIPNGHVFASIIDHLIADLVGKPISRRPCDVSKRTSDRLARGLRHIADRLLFSRNEDKTVSAAKYLLTLVSRQIDPPSTGEARIILPWPIAVNEWGKILL